METNLAPFIKDTPQGREADGILRKCVHCGFCTATCPTYQLLGDELDGPRGRIYLIKQVLEGRESTAHTQLHLDRCLTCRSCETTCPSGVRYGRLVEIGREAVETRVRRPWLDILARRLLRGVFPYTNRFTPLLRLGQMVRPLLPAALKRKIPAPQDPGPWPEIRHPRRLVLLEGCVQPAIAPRIDAAAARVLDRLGISVVRPSGSTCCGAVSYHLNAHREGLDFMRRNIDALWPHLESGAEGILSTATACAGMVKEYAELFADDPTYAAKAARISEMTRDLSEVLAGEDLEGLRPARGTVPGVAFHAPCTLQHGQKLAGLVESILTRLGMNLTPVPDAHLCCGSAGTYSILQPAIAGRLLDGKLSALESGAPGIIATANIGCLVHLQSGTGIPVTHWIQLVDDHMNPPRTGQRNPAVTSVNAADPPVS